MKGYTYFVMGMFASVATVLIVFWMLAPQEVEGPAELEEDGFRADVTKQEADAEYERPIMTATTLIQPEDWERTEQTEQDLAEALEDNQKIGWILDAGDRYYFATSSKDDAKEGYLWSIYSYTVEDYSFERLLKTTLEEGVRLDAVAIDQNTLYVLRHQNSDFPGTCKEGLYELSLDNINSLNSIEDVPDSVRQSASISESSCAF